MSKQTFTTGQVLTAAQVNSLQSNDFNQTVSVKTAAYTLVAADKGTRIEFNTSGSVTCTVNTGLFDAGDTLVIQNRGAGTVTVTAGTATVDTNASLAVAQYGYGTLYFVSASASIFFADAAPAGGKVLQVITATHSTATTSTSTTFADTGLTASITPSAATSKILVLVSQPFKYLRSTTSNFAGIRLMRGATFIFGDNGATGSGVVSAFFGDPLTNQSRREMFTMTFLDSPNTTSSTTYKTQLAIENAGNSASATTSESSSTASIILLEIGA